MGLGRKLYERHLQDSSLTLRVTKETNQKAAGKPVAFLNTLKKPSNTASKRLRSKRLSDKSFITLTDFEQKSLIRLNDFHISR